MFDVNSKLFVIFLLILLNLFHKAQGRPYKILSPMKAGYHSQPSDLSKHIVSVRYGDDGGFFGSNHMCSGVILSESVIITSSDCLIDKFGTFLHQKDFQIIAGIIQRYETSDEMQVRKVKKIIHFGFFFPYIDKGDIALFHLESPLDENENNVQRIPLADEEIKHGWTCTTFGWGAILPLGPKPDELIFTEVNILRPETCVENFKLKHGLICGSVKGGGGMDTGKGDAGSPLICSGKLSGVVSYSTEQFQYSFYVDVWRYRDWIKRNEAMPLPKYPFWMTFLSAICVACNRIYSINIDLEC